MKRLVLADLKIDLMAVMIDVGKEIGKIHQSDLIHGDLTTSNIMIKERKPVNSRNNKQYIIDWGLSNVSTKTEDRAVDLYVFERALISTHPTHPELVKNGNQKQFSSFIEGYKAECQNGSEIVTKFESVRKRGRKRNCFG